MYPEIEGVLDQYVRPLLRAHGGDMEVLELTDDGVLRFRLRGRCAGCPASDLTTEDLIRAEVTQRLPQVRQVELVYKVSEELLQQARAILRDHYL